MSQKKIEREKSAIEMVRHVSTHVDTMSSTFSFNFWGIKNEMVFACKCLFSRDSRFQWNESACTRIWDWELQINENGKINGNKESRDKKK